MSRHVPVVDLGAFLDGTGRETVASQVDAACRASGFLILARHGVDQELLDRTVALMREFCRQPVERKREFAGRGRGYADFANMSLGQSYGAADPPDLREGFTVRRSDVLDPGSPVWGPAVDSGLHPTLRDYYVAMNEVADTVMDVFASALGREHGYFRQFTAGHDSNLGFFHYPPMSAPSLPGQLRGGAHTDFGSVTVLYADPSVEGLQVRIDDVWEDIPVLPGTLVVNLGDLMQRWTNDLWKSTVHRVVNPVDGNRDSDRMSIAFFHQPDPAAVIASLDTGSPARYPVITSGEHFEAKMKAMQLAT